MRHGMALVVAAVVFSSGVEAAELPRNGPVEGRFYSHGVQKIDDLQFAEGMKAYINESFAFHVGKQHGSFFDGTTERCVGYGKYSEGGAVKEIGRCTVVDADGDKVFDEYEVQLTGTNDKTPGKATFVGGTGKYTGIRGTFTVAAEAWPEIGNKTDTMWAGDYKGEYKIGE